MSFDHVDLVSSLAADGLVAIDELTSAACMIHDVTASGLRLTLLDGAEVPARFVLAMSGGMRVCRVVRRADEEIEAAFVDLGNTAMRAPRLVLGRRFLKGADERRAA